MLYTRPQFLSKIFSESYHTNKMLPPVRETYFRCRDAFDALCTSHGYEAECRLRKNELIFRCNNKPVFGVQTQMDRIHIASLTLRINLKKGEELDPYGITDDVSASKGAGGPGHYRVRQASNRPFELVFALIKSAYNKRVRG